MPRPAQTFGRRRPAPPRPVPPVFSRASIPAAPAGEPETVEQDAPVVPRSMRAALLAGLAVGFCLAGLDVTHAGALDPALQVALQGAGLGDVAQRALPYTIALSLLAGGRAAATTLLIAHFLLARARVTGFAAYAAAGGGVAAGAAALMLALGHPPAHGWGLEVAGGAAAGALYRLFAGARSLMPR